MCAGCRPEEEDGAGPRADVLVSLDFPFLRGVPFPRRRGDAYCDGRALPARDVAGGRCIARHLRRCARDGVRGFIIIMWRRFAPAEPWLSPERRAPYAVPRRRKELGYLLSIAFPAQSRGRGLLVTQARASLPTGRHPFTPHRHPSRLLSSKPAFSSPPPHAPVLPISTPAVRPAHHAHAPHGPRHEAQHVLPHKGHLPSLVEVSVARASTLASLPPYVCKAHLHPGIAAEKGARTHFAAQHCVRHSATRLCRPALPYHHRRYWARWIWNFGGWMASGTVVNSGLRYVESLIAIEMRQNLTRAAHARYLTAR